MTVDKIAAIMACAGVAGAIAGLLALYAAVHFIVKFW